MSAAHVQHVSRTNERGAPVTDPGIDADHAPRTRDVAITSLTWALAGALVLVVAPAIRSQVPLSDELDLGSLLLPWWSLLQIAVLALVLRALRKRSLSWSTARRAWTGTTLAALVFLLSPSVLSLLSSVLGDDLARLGRDQVQVALLWSTPLLFYVIPAALVVYMWSKNERFTVARSVGAAAIAIAMGNLVAIFWFTSLWARFVRTGG